MTNPTTRKGLPTELLSKRKWSTKLAAGAAALAVVASGIAGLSLPAQAATGGTGWGEFGSSARPYKGTFIQDAIRIICAEAGKTMPTGNLSNAGLRGSAWVNSNFRAADGSRPSISDDQLAGINRALHDYGDTGDKNTAAALEYAVRAVLYPSNADLDWTGGHQGSMNRAINWDLYSVAGSGNVSTIQSMAAQMVGEINSTSAGTGSTGSGSLTFTVDPANNYAGTVKMDGTPGSTGTIVLSNGVFVSTGGATLENAAEGVDYRVEGVPPTDDGKPYKISGSGTFTAPGTSGYAANITAFVSGSGQQSSMGAGGMASNQPFSVSGEDPQVRGVQFLPVVKTTATTFVQPGEKFTDTLQFSTVADSQGTNNPLFRSAATGKYATVTAKGTVYGPFPSQPAESNDVPTGAPVAGTATVTTSAADGFATQYSASSDTVAKDGGYYTWVWSIDWKDQDSAVTQYVVPGPSPSHPDQQPYYYQDAFGQVAESHIVPSDITATSEITAPEVPLSGQSNDRIDVSANGFWNQVANAATGSSENIPVVFRGTAYFVPGADAPAQQKATDPLPEGTVELGSTTITVDGPGDYTPEKGITAPPTGIGHITWVWKIDPADQDEKYRGMVRPWSDDFGVPAETQLVAQPKVSTMAQPGVKLGETFKDTAKVEATLPANGAELTFEGYKIPMKDDGTGKWVVDAPGTGTDGKPLEAGDLSWVCTADNQVFSNVGHGESVSKPGEYNSPEVKADEHGKYLWVESLYSVPLNNGDEPKLIAKGECGLLNETTFAIDVTTKAHTTDGSGTAAFGEELWDTATLTGYVPEGGTVEFKVHQTKKGETPVCTDDNLLTTLQTQDGKPLEGGLYTKEVPLELTSVKWKNAVDYDSDVYFVEVTKDSSGRIVSQGECGDTEETVAANAAVAAVARTDGAITGIIAGGAGLIVLIGLGTLLVIRRRKQAVSAD